MIYSKTCEYAIRALQFLAEKKRGTYVRTRMVSQATGVPLAYLAKIFQDLVRNDILDSRRGAAGGFALKEDTKLISVKKIMEVIDGPKNLKVCLMGLNSCSDLNGCPLHGVWKTFRKKILDEMQNCSLASLARKAGKVRYRDLKRSRLHVEA